MKTEKDLFNYVKKRCKEEGILCDKLESRTRRGWPDLVLIEGGRVMFIELKSPSGNGVVSNHQLKVINDINDHGGETYYVSSKDAANVVIGMLLC